MNNNLNNNENENNINEINDNINNNQNDSRSIIGMPYISDDNSQNNSVEDERRTIHRPLHLVLPDEFFENIIIANENNRFNNVDENRKKLVNDLLEYELNKVDKLEEGNKKCVICLEHFNAGDKIISLPCVHIYHSDCIKKWLLEKNFCPICKYAFNNDDFNN